MGIEKNAFCFKCPYKELSSVSAPFVLTFNSSSIKGSHREITSDCEMAGITGRVREQREKRLAE